MFCNFRKLLLFKLAVLPSLYFFLHSLGNKMWKYLNVQIRYIVCITVYICLRYNVEIFSQSAGSMPQLLFRKSWEKNAKSPPTLRIVKSPFASPPQMPHLYGHARRYYYIYTCAKMPRAVQRVENSPACAQENG